KQHVFQRLGSRHELPLSQSSPFPASIARVEGTKDDHYKSREVYRMAANQCPIIDNTRPNEEPTGPGNLYLLSEVDLAMPHRDLGRVKFGIARDIELRIEELQTGNPNQLCCEASFSTPVARQVERWIRRANASRIVHGEWLRLTRPGIPRL